MYALVLFIALMIIVLPFVFIASFWGKTKGGNFIYHILRIWGAIWFPAIGIFCRNIYQSKPDPNRQYIFIANHISYLDAAIIVMAIRQKFRPLGKVEMSKIPLFGFIYRCCVVMVDRADAKDRAKSVRQMKSVLNRGISILIFPEGTFNMTGGPLKDFYDGAFRIAIETQTPLKPIVFLDSSKRMHYSNFFSLTPGPNRAVFLDEIAVEGLGSRDVAVLKAKAYEAMRAAIVSRQS